jgi:hypothetical protein
MGAPPGCVGGKLAKHSGSGGGEQSNSGWIVGYCETTVPPQRVVHRRIHSLNTRVHGRSAKPWIEDFHADSDNSRLNAKIMEIYGVDVSDIQSGGLAAIFERIAQS